MTGPRQLATKTALLETTAMDLHEAGMSFEDIARRLDVPAARVERVINYMSESSRERCFARDTRAADARYVAAVLSSGGSFA